MKKSVIRIIMALIAALLYASSFVFEGFFIDHTFLRKTYTEMKAIHWWRE